MKVIFFNKKRITFFIILIIIGFLFFSNFNLLVKLMYPLKYEEHIIKGARKYSLDPYLISSMIYVESKFVEGAHSHRGAVGLMQIMPGTAKWIAEKRGEVFQQEKLYRPEINIDYGCWYLASLKKEFDGDMLYVLAAYNAGRGTLKHWCSENSVKKENMLETIPYPETRNYVRQVMKVYEIYCDLYELKERV